MAITTTKCTACGLDHEAQREYWPTGTTVKAVSRIINPPYQEIPIGATGKVTAHCDNDGRAWVLFDGYPEAGHTFHQIEDFLGMVKQPVEQKKGARA